MPAAAAAAFAFSPLAIAIAMRAMVCAARALAGAGYATDPDYADKLIAVMGNRPGGRKMAQYDVPTKAAA